MATVPTCAGRLALSWQTAECAARRSGPWRRPRTLPGQFEVPAIFPLGQFPTRGEILTISAGHVRGPAVCSDGAYSVKNSRRSLGSEMNRQACRKIACRVPRSISMIGNGERLCLAVFKNAANLDMAASLGKRTEAKFAEDRHDLASGERSQPWHQATASNSMVARMVGLVAIPSAARSSPSR